MKVSMLASLSVLFMMSCGSNEKKQVDNIVIVKTMPAQAMADKSGQGYAGTIEELNGTPLSFSYPGTIKTLHLKEGQKVSSGQLLGTIDASTNQNAVVVAQATTVSAEEALKQAEDAYRRMKMLHDNGSLPEIKWIEVETKVAQARQMLRQAKASEQIARKGLADTRLVAPFSGYIVRKTADVGQNVLPGQSVASLVKIDQVKVKLSVPEDEIAKIQMGQTVQFSVSSLGSTSFLGRIVEKGVSSDPISRNYEVKALVENKSHQLLPGMICDVYLSGNSAGSFITLPANLIQIDDNNQPFVWAVEKGAAKKKAVTLGDNVGDNVIITGGLMNGEQVIVEGQQKVSNGTKVKVS